MVEFHVEEGMATASQRTTLTGFSNNMGSQVPGTPNGVRILSDTEKSWLAGVIDGEGSIFISKVTKKKGYSRRGFFYRPMLSVGNANSSFLFRVREIIGKGYVGMDKEGRRDWKDKWQYKGTRQVLRGILPQVLPYLVVKRKVAEKMLEYLSFVNSHPINGTMVVPPRHDEKVDSLYMAVKRLNARGPESSTDGDVDGAEASEGLWMVNRNRGRPTGHRATARSLAESKKAWLAGVIDGEGSIFLSKVFDPRCKRKFFYRPQLAISNTNRRFLIVVAQSTGEGTVLLAKKGDVSCKARWQYQANAGVLRSVLPQIISYMIIKRALAEKMMQYFAFVDQNPIYGLKEVPPEYYEKLDQFYWEIKKLNKKGRNVSSGL